VSFWENFKRLIRNDIPAQPLQNWNYQSESWGELFGPVSGLPPITEQTAMKISAVFACVNLIAGAISALPMNVYRRKPDGERDQLQNDDLWWVLNEQFLPRWSAANGWEYLVLSLLFHGDAFAVIKRQGPVIVGLEPVHPNRVQALPTSDGMRLVYAVSPDPRLPNSSNGYLVYDQDDILHVAGFGFDGCRSVSPLKHHLSMSGAVALATQDYAGRFFSNNARPDLVLKSDQPINRETADDIANKWANLYSGTQNAHKPAVLGMGFSVQPLSISAEDAQLLATRQFQIEEIARAYGVPPFMIGHTEKTTSWGSGVETMGQGFVRFTLRQHLNKFQNEINRKFFRTAGKFAEFDTFELEKADMQTLFNSYRTALGRAGEKPFITAEEVRNRLNLKRVPDHGTLDPVAAKGDTNAQEPAAQPSQK
jgi:HK97 family phage portal protein